jgi:hypothetical protein
VISDIPVAFQDALYLFAAGKCNTHLEVGLLYAINALIIYEKGGKDVNVDAD